MAVSTYHTVRLRHTLRDARIPERQVVELTALLVEIIESAAKDGATLPTPTAAPLPSGFTTREVALGLSMWNNRWLLRLMAVYVWVILLLLLEPFLRH